MRTSRAARFAMTVLLATATVALLTVPSLQAAARHDGVLTVTDDAGHSLRLPGPARRIVSLAPHITELLFAAGAGRQVVGTVQYSDYPPAAGAIPVIGSAMAVDIEALLALRPDLVIVWQSGNRSADIARLRQLDLPLYFSEPRTLDDVALTLSRFGLLAATPAPADRARQQFNTHLARLRRRYRDAAPVTVFYEVWNRPLMTVNGDHLISRVIRLCGGRNVFAALPGLVAKPTLEALLQRDPEVIITSDTGSGRDDWLRDWQRWPQLQAVANRRLYMVPPDILQRHGPRILEAADRVCEILDEVRARR